jgi:hypothetical protein
VTTFDTNPDEPREANVMRATIGDRLHVHGRTVGATDRVGEIIEVRGEGGAPPYLVRFPDGHESLVYPGADSVIETAEGQAR